MNRSLTGIKPTGTIHVGNYLGAMRPALELADRYPSSLYFIADYHALTSVHDRRAMHATVYDVAAAWLAAGIDPERTLLYRQSAIIDTATNKPVAFMEVGERPWGIDVSRDGKTLFTANGPSNDVSIVDLATRTVMAKVQVGNRPWGVVYVP